MTDTNNFPPPSRKTTRTATGGMVISETVLIAEFKKNRGGDFRSRQATPL
jgi:hypothetical protein